MNIIFSYHFDEDGFSMYDKNHRLDGKITIDKLGKILNWVLEETETGIATVAKPYKTESKETNHT